MINKQLKRKPLRQRFAADGRVRIDDFIDTQLMVDVHEEMQRVPFDLVYVLEGKIQTTSKQKMDGMQAEQKQRVNQTIVSQAARGEGFLYGSCHMGAGRPAEIGAQMVKLFEFLSSEEMFEFVRWLTRDTSVNDVSGHYTRYLPGHFLTRHRDEVVEERRRFAYVLSFTQAWHPDWGGLLQFYEEDGTPRDAWAPRFNSLTLFDVRHIHAVTYVTPFAQGPRLSLTGWFNNKTVQ